MSRYFRLCGLLRFALCRSFIIRKGRLKVEGARRLLICLSVGGKVFVVGELPVTRRIVSSDELLDAISCAPDPLISAPMCLEKCSVSSPPIPTSRGLVVPLHYDSQKVPPPSELPREDHPNLSISFCRVWIAEPWQNRFAAGCRFGRDMRRNLDRADGPVAVLNEPPDRLALQSSTVAGGGALLADSDISGGYRERLSSEEPSYPPPMVVKRARSSSVSMDRDVVAFSARRAAALYGMSVSGEQRGMTSTGSLPTSVSSPAHLVGLRDNL